MNVPSLATPVKYDSVPAFDVKSTVAPVTPFPSYEDTLPLNVPPLAKSTIGSTIVVFAASTDTPSTFDGVYAPSGLTVIVYNPGIRSPAVYLPVSSLPTVTFTDASSSFCIYTVAGRYVLDVLPSYVIDPCIVPVPGTRDRVLLNSMTVSSFSFVITVKGSE